MNSQKCSSCLATQFRTTMKYYCCNPSTLFCKNCQTKKCNICQSTKNKKKYQTIKCGGCFNKVWKETVFLNYKNTYLQEYFCYKCVKSASRKSSFKLGKYDKAELTQYLQLFCFKCEEKILTRLQQTYRDQKVQRYYCTSCVPVNKKISSCALCGKGVDKKSENGLVLCQHCFNVSMIQENMLKSQVKVEQKIKGKQKLSQNKLQKTAQYIEPVQDQKVQEENSKLVKKSQKNKELQNIPVKDKESDPISVSNKQIQSSPESNKNFHKKRKNSQLVLQNVNMLMNLNKKQFIQCDKCGYQIQKVYSMDSKDKNLCRGCFTIETIITTHDYSRNSIISRKPVEEPKSRHITVEKPQRGQAEIKTSIIPKKSLFDDYYQIPLTQKYNILKEPKKEQLNTQFQRSSGSIVHLNADRKRCKICAKSIAFPSDNYCVSCKDIAKNARLKRY